ncbi:YecA/YgfB family protein [Vibrio gallicus]|uniref:YecA/YgfB family protein n=1 Tax=Vibrio gallicus TaxID=190897 RepID=UPI0021C4B010|nr:YecA family protein [Vibrio gallicus]
MSQTKLPQYQPSAEQLSASDLSVTPAEMHGLLMGMLSGGLQLDSDGWQPLLFDYTNDGQGWPMASLAIAELALKVSREELSKQGFELSLLLPESDDLIAQGAALSEWVSHFISGLGLVGAKVDKSNPQVKEVLEDLLEISKLEIDPEDDLQEQAMLLEQVIEHVKVCVLTIHIELGNKPSQPESKTLH